VTPAQTALDAIMEGVTAAVERLANTPMQMSVVEWQAVSSQLLAPLALAAEVRAQRETIAGLTARVEALTGALDNIRELNMTGQDENGHRWAHSDLIEQEIVAAKGHPND
jgi:hypothetical protein